MFDVSEIQSIIELIAQTVAISGTVALAALGGYALFKLMTLASMLWFAKFVVQKTYELIVKKLDQKVENILFINKSKFRMLSDCDPTKIESSIVVAISKHGNNMLARSELDALCLYIESYKK